MDQQRHVPRFAHQHQLASVQPVSLALYARSTLDPCSTISCNQVRCHVLLILVFIRLIILTDNIKPINKGDINPLKHFGPLEVKV